MAPTWPSIIPLGATTSAPAAAWASGDALVELERGVVEHVARRARARRSARGRCTRRGRDRRSARARRRRRRARHAAPPAPRRRDPRPRSPGVLSRRDPEEDHPRDPERHQPLGLDDQRVDGVLHLARHRRDRGRRRRCPPARTAGRRGRRRRGASRPPGAAAPGCGAAGASGAPGTRAAAGTVGGGSAMAVQPTRRCRHRGPKWPTSSATMPSADAPQASCTPAPAGRRGPPRPWSARCRRRAGATVSGAPSGSATPRTPSPRSVAVNDDGVAAATRASSVGLGRRTGRRCGRPRPAEPPIPCPRGPSTSVPGERSAQGNRTRRLACRPAAGNSSTRPRALCSAGTRSGSTPAMRAARRRWPARPRPPSTGPSVRASRSSAMKRSTALTEVSTTQSVLLHLGRRGPQARRHRRRGRPGAVSGSSITVAPARSSAVDEAPGARARAGHHHRPARQRPRLHRCGGCDRRRARPPDRSRSRQGGPRSTSARPASVVRATRSDGVVPRAITATGVSGGRPPRSRASAMAARVVMPIRIDERPAGPGQRLPVRAAARVRPARRRDPSPPSPTTPGRAG